VSDINLKGGLKLLWLKKIFSRRQRRERIWRLLTGNNTGVAVAAETHEKTVATIPPSPTRDSKGSLSILGSFLKQAFRLIGLATTSIIGGIVRAIAGVLSLFEFAVWLVVACLVILLLVVLLQHAGISLPVGDWLKNIQEVFSR
jgi:hypothetical protein